MSIWSWWVTAFGAGRSPMAPGTVGTLWAWLVYALLLGGRPDGFIAAFVGIYALVSWVAVREYLKTSASPDPSAVVCDEVLAFWLILWLTAPSSWLLQLAAFVLFRFFDAVKPGPIAWVDLALKGRGWRGAWGVHADDLAAALATLLCMALWRAV